MSILRNVAWWINRTFLYTKRPDGKFILRQEERMIARLRRLWRKQMDYYLNEIEDFDEFQVETNQLQSDLETMFENDPVKDQIPEAIVFYMALVMQRGVKTQNRRIKRWGYEILFPDLIEDANTEFLEAKLSHELSDFAGNINGVTEKRIAQLVDQAVNEGETYTWLANQITQQGEAGVFSAARAKRIAVRELGVSYEQGKKSVVDQFTVENPDVPVYKYWQTVNDDRVTELCQHNQDEGIIPFGDRFSSGDARAPRNTNIGCRCSTNETLDPNQRF